MNPLAMDTGTLLTSVGICVEIFFVDLLLSADNALVIALACRGLPADEMRRAAIAGTAGAIALRIAMAAVVLVLLNLPFLRIVAAILLLVIAVRLTGEATDPEAAAARVRPRQDFAAAVVAIVVADAVMSLDNVVAIATIAQGSLILLGIGLAMSVPMLIAGSSIIHTHLASNRVLVTLGGIFLGWIAGQIGVGDPLVADWIGGTAPALPIAVPAACAIFVFWEGRILAGR